MNMNGKKICRWKKRSRRQFAVGRMTWFSPKSGEVFYLRLLLVYVRGATSFEDLRTVNGEICATFRDACVKRGLLIDDNHVKNTMT